MSILKWGGGVIGQLGLGLLAVNLMSPHPVNSVPPTPIALPPAYQVVKTVEWSLQIDEATLGQQLNAWAAGQPILPTPPQIDQWTVAYHATVQSVHLGEGTLVLSGTRH